MVDEKNEENEENPIDEDILKLILSISMDARHQILGGLTGTIDQIWKTLNFLILLGGIYVTLFIFICGNQQDESIPILWPTILSGFFLLIALILSIKGIFPTASLPNINPNEIYKLLYEKKDESTKKLIETYLIHSKKVQINAEEKSLIRKKIILFIAISIINFLLFGVYCVFHDYEVYVNILAIVFSIGFILYYIYYIHKERDRINKLRINLNQ